MSDLRKYVNKRIQSDPEFADNFFEGYESFKVGVLLRQERKAAGMTQEDMAHPLIKRIKFLTVTLLLASALFLPMEVATAQLKATLEGHADNVWSVAFSPDGQMLASGSWDQTVRLWDVNTEQLLYTLVGHTHHVNSVVFSPDGQTLVSSDWDGNIRLWDPHTGKLKRALNEHHGSVPSVVFSPDGTMLASGHGDHTIGLWNTTTWQLERTLTGHATIVDTVAFSPDGQRLASGSRDKTIRLWNPHTGKHIKTFPLSSEVKYLAFSPDGSTLASSSWDKTIRLWNPKTGEIKTTLPDQTGWVNPVVFSPDGATLAIGGRGISLWDTETGQYLGPLHVAGDILSVAFSPDGQTVANGSADNKVRLWEFIRGIPPNVGEPHTVRLIYFLARDRPVERNIDTKLDKLVKDVQQFYEVEMERHGFGRKTFMFETDATGKAVVHHVDGQFTGSYYVGDGNLHTIENNVMSEIKEQFDISKNLYIVVVDVGQAWGGVGGGFALITTNGDCHDTGSDFFILLAHELAHAFGLAHDFRNGAYITSYSSRVVVQLSECAAEWLDVHPYFNASQTAVNAPTTIQMLPPLDYPPNAIRLRFTITDADGLHQAQLIGRSYRGPKAISGPSLIACKKLNGQSETVEFVTTEFAPSPDSSVTVAVIDVNGNFTRQQYSIREEDVQVDVNDRVDINGDGVINVDDRVPATLRIVSGDNQRSSPNSWLAEPFVVEVRDVDGEPVVGIEVAFREENAALGALSATNPRTDSNGQAQSFLIPPFAMDYQVQASVPGVKPVVFNATGSGPQVLLSSSELPPMYWISGGDSFGGGSIEGLINDRVDTFGPFATSIVLDVSSDGKFYWTAVTVPGIPAACGAILSGSPVIPDPFIFDEFDIYNFFYGSDILAVLTSTVPLGITIDATKDKLYWANSRGNIQRANLDGSNIETFITGLNSPQDIVVDIADSKIYWTETQGRIRRANLNGSNIQTFATDLGALGSITIAGDNLYWTEKISETHGKIRRASLNGANVEDLITLPSVPVGIAVDIVDGKIYWTETQGRIRRANLNGSNIEDIIINLIAPGDLSLNILVPRRLLYISGDNQKGLAGAALENPFVIEAQDTNGAALVGISVRFAVTAGGGRLNTTITRTDTNGRAESTLTLGPNLGTNTVKVSAAGIQGKVTFHAISDTEAPPISADVNNDGNVNVLDLISIASELGNTGTNLVADVNRDGVVSILDLILVAGTFESVPAAPSTHPQVPETLTTVEVQGWLTDARALEVRDPIMKRGFMVLEQLLLFLTPKETELLANYPNPFNPETWIPYRLAEDVFVTLTIYDSRGHVVRTLEVGHRIASAYESRSQAIYWDGRNGLGEQVANGVYFYTLTAGDFSATRRMVILK